MVKCKENQTDKVTLCYNLFDLPTAQHKAGLAGLVLMLTSMERRGLAPLPEVRDLSSNGVRILLSRESLQTLFDDLFDAEFVEAQVKSKWPGTVPKNIIEVISAKDSGEERETRFVYDVLEPKGLFLQDFFPDGNGAWIALWRKMLWNILRAQPAARKVYEERSRGEQSSVAKDVFASLCKEIKQAGKGKKVSESISGSLFLGAQNKNAENVPFAGLPSENFLLHFWHIVALIFIPRTFALERGKNEVGRVIWQDCGFALVIPEPSHLKGFIRDICNVLRGLDTARSGRWPSKAIVNLLQESGLEYLHYFIHHQGQVDCIYAVEIYHVHKQGNNVKMLAMERFCPKKNVLEEYERLRTERRNPIFNRFYLQNVLQGRAWYCESDNIMRAYPAELLVYSSRKTPSTMHYFGVDAWKKFFSIEKKLRLATEGKMKIKDHQDDHQIDQDDLLALRVRNIVRQYVQRKVEKKTGISFRALLKDEGERVIYPAAYKEAVEKICMDIFLAMRDRKGQDFVAYFTETLCSEPQCLPEGDFLFISQALIHEQDKMKNLSLLAVSACSYLPRNKKR
ncbi:Type I-MYXAN CRISPR-associated protein Cmx8 [Candidatus Electrothrix laxa]